MVKTKMLYIAYCIAFYEVTVSVVLAQTVKTYTKCVQVGTKSVNRNPFLNSDCISAIDGAIMCTEVAECTVFTYDDLTKTCRLYQMIDTVNCDFNEENGGITFTKETDNVYLGCRLYDGNWQWTTSGQELLLNDTLWAPNEPRGEECIQIWAGKFDDTGCFHQLDIVCEKVGMLRFYLLNYKFVI
ncbi:unnamed protein product [Mytilus coruscus]|uniref:C-type lectin domain-containing protein n=1 Tax=Mytilus coruscus TaxID=42192 RepID=A0A6J8EMZ0_MYTCO|nr:unnamed protein product [Mytilus coruscus]